MYMALLIFAILAAQGQFEINRTFDVNEWQDMALECVTLGEKALNDYSFENAKQFHRVAVKFVTYPVPQPIAFIHYELAKLVMLYDLEIEAKSEGDGTTMLLIRDLRLKQLNRLELMANLVKQLFKGR